ncbi:MAG: VCBS repeat-containing protein [Acidobacteria bacterium]|nr:VCBS repeat-containing protein [Acidobacteriota bacterium]
MRAIVLLFALVVAVGWSAAQPALDSVQLPANPVDVAAGDVDGDGTSEIVLLLLYPAWGSAAEVRDTAEGQEVDVVAALQDRRELRAYAIEGGTRLRLAAPPLPLEGGVYALDALPRGGPMVAMTAAGPARVVVRTAASGAEGRADADPGQGAVRLELLSVAAAPPVFAGVERFFSFAPLAADLDGDGQPESLVPTGRGLVAVRLADGALSELSTPLADVASGGQGRIRVTLPRVLDVDRDGTVDLVDVDDRTRRVALRRGLGGGRFAPAVDWDLGGLLAERPQTAGTVRSPWLLDVLDVDADGTLEAAIAIREDDAESKPSLRALKGGPHTIAFHPLVPGRAAGGAPESTLRGTFTAPLELPREDSFSPFLDVDGNGTKELLVFDMALGYFGVAKAVTTGNAKVGVTPRGFRFAGGAWVEIPKLAPAFDVRLNLRQGELRGFALLPGDVTGDRLDDMVVLDGDEVVVHAGRADGTIEPRPRTRARLPRAEPRSSFLPVFVDLDGDGALELIAVEQLEEREGEPARPTQLSLHRFSGAGVR